MSPEEAEYLANYFRGLPEVPWDYERGCEMPNPYPSGVGVKPGPVKPKEARTINHVARMFGPAVLAAQRKLGSRNQVWDYEKGYEVPVEYLKENKFFNPLNFKNWNSRAMLSWEEAEAK